MNNQELATHGQQIEGPRIEVSGAITIINRAANRLSFLLESMFYENSADRGCWWALDREKNYSEKLKQELQREKEKTVSGIYNVVLESLDDLVRVYSLRYPEEMPDWAWLIEEVEKAPILEWKGPDLSCGLPIAIDYLDLLVSGALANLGAGGLGSFSPEGVLGFKAIIEDIRKQLDKILIELKSTVH